MKTIPYLVGDVIELVRRPVRLDPDEIYKEIGLRSFGKGVFHKPSVLGSELGDKRVFSITPGDLIFSNVFAWEGAVAVASADEEGLIGSHRFMTYRVDDEIADTRYLFYYFISERGLEIIRRASPGSAGRNKTLGIKSFAGQTVNLPSLVEQRRIATRLDRASSGIGDLHRGRRRSAVLAQRIADSLLSDLTIKRTLGDFLVPVWDFTDIEPSNIYRVAGVYSHGKGRANSR